MSARAGKCHAVPVRPDATIHDAAGTPAVDGNQAVNAVGAFPKQVLHPSKISQTLLAHIADEPHISFGFKLRKLHGAKYGQNGDQTATVITNAGRVEPVALLTDSQISFKGKDRVQMSGVGDYPIAPRARTFTDYVADLIYSHFVETSLLE